MRDRAIFVGDPDDIVAGALRARAARDPRLDRGSTSSFAGYVTGFDPAGSRDRAALRAELGYRPGRAGVHRHRRRLGRRRRRCCAGDRRASRRPSELVPELRMVVVAGPRIDPAIAARGRRRSRSARYVPDLYRHLAACDLAVVQGGLTTAMELTANRRPFIYVPAAAPLRAELPRPPPAGALRRRAAHGLRRRADPDAIAAAIAEEIGREVDYRPVATDGAARAAALIAELL